MIDNLKTKHINVLAIQLSCQKLFSSYLGYKKTLVICIIKLLLMLALSPHLIRGRGIYMLVVESEHSVCRN